MTHDLPSVDRLTMALRRTSANLSRAEAEALCKSFYIFQDQRKATDSQVRTIAADGAPAPLLEWLSAQAHTIENQIANVMGRYADSFPHGAWARRQHGIGPILAGGFVAMVPTKRETIGKIWAFAGLVPGVKWEKGCKRPWNPDLRTLAWKAGQCFMKSSNHPDSYYGRIYRERKAKEIARNESGALAEQAAAALKAKKYDKSTEAWRWYSGCYPSGAMTELLAITDPAARSKRATALRGEPGSGLPMLPPAHIDARARRYAVKLFLSHFWDVAYRERTGERPPAVYPIAHLGHTDYIPPPGYE